MSFLEMAKALRGNAESAVSAKNAKTAKRSALHYQPTNADHDLAELFGLEGSRQQFLGAVALVAHFDNELWSEADALAALVAWWDRDVETLSAVEWIMSAARADAVLEASKSSNRTKSAGETE